MRRLDFENARHGSRDDASIKSLPVIQHKKNAHFVRKMGRDAFVPSQSHDERDNDRSKTKSSVYIGKNHEVFQQSEPDARSYPYYEPKRPQQLVLKSSENSSDDVHSSHALNNEVGMVRKLLQVGQNDSKSRPSTQDQTVRDDRGSDIAATFAKNSSKAGFLYKFGTNIQHYKRRFFILKPATHLYYFLSPNDNEPRGCIDLEHTSIHDGQELPDGRYRFKISMYDNQILSNNQNESLKTIFLEAKSKEIGEEWVRNLREERLTFSKEKAANIERELNELAAKTATLENQIDDLRLVEKDRDGAIEDALEWKKKFKDLDNAVKLLCHHLKRRYDEDNIENDDNKPPSADNKKNTSVGSISDVQRQLEHMELGNSNFSSLHNTCQMLLENNKLTSKEATSALEDVQHVKADLNETQEKLLKAEKLVCKLWEENCTMRDTIKQIKKEKKVLVKEVKSMMSASAAIQSQNSHDHAQESKISESQLILELEEHVTSSLRLHEQFLAANGRRGNGNNKTDQPITTRNTEEAVSLPGSTEGEISNENTIISNNCNRKSNDDLLLLEHISGGKSKLDETLSPLRPTRLNLPDQEKKERAEPSVLTPLRELSSVDVIDENFYSKEKSGNAAATDYDGYAEQNNSSTHNERLKQSKPQHSCESGVPQSSEESHKDDLFSNFTNNELNAEGHSPHAHKPHISVDNLNIDRRNPSLRMSEDYDQNPPNLCASSSQSSSSRSAVTDNGQATSKLFCPLNDAVSSVSDGSSSNALTEGGEVYHLTFYNRKIGIQFQKIPIEASSGALTAAMTTDVEGGDGSDSRHGRTVSELRVIASISGPPARGRASSTSSSSSNNDDEFCRVAAPIDAVLVCGFNGFDDSGSNQRPKLGARLVAFDGVSIEIGRWTFGSVKRAIQARGRPLTLSFRNDYLTPKQREILAKAVSEVDVSRAGYPPKSNHVGRLSHNLPTSGFVRGNNDSSRPNGTNDNSATPNSLKSYNSHRSGVSSFSSPLKIPQSSRSVTGGGGGTSSILSSAIGPLVAGLMSNLTDSERKRRETPMSPRRPQYLQDDSSNSLDSMRDHHDFKAGLL